MINKNCLNTSNRNSLAMIRIRESKVWQAGLCTGITPGLQGVLKKTLSFADNIPGGRGAF
jgi:hypothetical protein